MTIITCEKCGWKGEDACPDCHQELPRIAKEETLPRVAEALIPICKDCGKMLVGSIRMSIKHGVIGDSTHLTLPIHVPICVWTCPDTLAEIKPVWIRLHGNLATPGQLTREPQAPG